MRSLAMVAISVCATSGVATAESDYQVSSAIGAEVRLSEQLSADASHELRLDIERSRLEADITDVAVAARVARWIRLGLGYRFAYHRDNGELASRHRLHADIVLRPVRGTVRFDYRARWQAPDPVHHVTRHRARVSVRIAKGVRSSVAVEPFFRIGPAPARMDKFRIALGAQWEVADYELQAFYRIDEPIDDVDERAVRVVGIGLTRAW